MLRRPQADAHPAVCGSPSLESLYQTSEYVKEPESGKKKKRLHRENQQRRTTSLRFSALTLSANLALGIPRSKGAAIIHRNPGFPSPHGCNYQSVSRSKCFCSCNGTGPAFGYGKVADSRVARGVRFFGRNCAATAFFPSCYRRKNESLETFQQFAPIVLSDGGFFLDGSNTFSCYIKAAVRDQPGQLQQ